MARAIHTWERKATQGKADKIYTALAHAVGHGATPVQCLTFAGYYVERLQMGMGARAVEVSYDHVTNYGGANAWKILKGRNAYAYRLCVYNHLGLLASSVGPLLADELGAKPDTPWGILTDMIRDGMGGGPWCAVLRYLLETEWAGIDPRQYDASYEARKEEQRLMQEVNGINASIPGSHGCCHRWYVLIRHRAVFTQEWTTSFMRARLDDLRKGRQLYRPLGEGEPVPEDAVHHTYHVYNPPRTETEYVVPCECPPELAMYYVPRKPRKRK